MKARSEVLDTYWYVAAERQRIFFQRLAGQLPPYTEDPIFQTYKFCNTYRASDRVSQFLIRSVIYDQSHSPEDVLFRILFFRLLNRIETWQYLEQRLGCVSLQNFSFATYATLLEEQRKNGPVYGNAFILCANKAFGYERKHENHLALLESLFVRSATGQQLQSAQSLKDLFCRLRAQPLLGDFMAYQMAIDCNYSPLFSFSENDFTVAGPGAKRGIAKCFYDTEGKESAEIIQWMVDHQEEEFARCGLVFQSLGTRPLHAIDCQGLFCETDKYCRARFPELKSNRVRIKQQFTPNPAPITYIYPPKWGITLPDFS